MRTLFSLIILFSYFSSVLADIKEESASQPVFELELGDGTSLSGITFSDANDNEAQTTCAMTPGAPSNSPLIGEPPIPVIDDEPPDRADMSPISTIGTVTPNLIGTTSPGRRFPPPPKDPPPPEVHVPEPMTLVLIGLGIGGAAVSARLAAKKRKNSTPPLSN